MSPSVAQHDMDFLSFSNLYPELEDRMCFPILIYIIRRQLFASSWREYEFPLAGAGEVSGEGNTEKASPASDHPGISMKGHFNDVRTLDILTFE